MTSDLSPPSTTSGTPADVESEPTRGPGWLPIAVLFIVAIGAVAWFASRSGETAVGDDEVSAAIAGIEFPLADGSTATLADYQGRPAVVNFFAAWCPPCRAEMPDFETVHQATRDEVAFVGISHDLNEAEWLDLVDETGVTFDTGFQPEQELFIAIDGIGMPTTIFLDADGTIVHTHAGVVNSEILTDLIDTHLRP